jgi:hypothetical protein
MRRVFDAAGAGHAAIEVLSMRQFTRCPCSNSSVVDVAIHALSMQQSKRRRCGNSRVAHAAIQAWGLHAMSAITAGRANA